MIEHPNYCTVLFNTLSGNAHLKLPHGEWIRIFADGNIRITATDEYSLDVDKNRAILSYPPCEMGRQSVPNMTSVRLWHTGSVPKPQMKGQENATVPSPAKLIETLTETEGKLGATESLQQKRASSPLGGKKSSRRNFEREKSKSHAKIRQKDPAARKLRGTRIASAIQVGDKGKSRSPSPGQVDSSSVSPGTGQDEANEGDAGGAQGETGAPKEVDADVEQSNAQEAEGPTLRNGEDDDVGDFLKFDNESTLCKSVDSWDNRFTMDLYGGIVVDKTKQENKQEQSTQQLIDSLAEYSALPKDYFAGILRNTSSEHLITAAKRFRSIKQSYMESCSGSLPKTKIFVVKRDLTGFQFMQKGVVDEIVTKAYGSQESMVIFDPLPKRQPRKFITVMRPVDEDEHPHGMWTRPYIEPMFRPKGVTNKHLKIANPNDLRWFGYVLSAAHARRPQFMPDAKNLFKIQKMTPSKSIDDVVEKPSNLPSEYEFEEEDEDEEYEGERTDSAHSGINSFRKPAPSIIEEDKKKKKKKDKEGKKHAKVDIF
ncbi:unnamed protein product [Orchesella dallaii]|uniref:Uncharacterized protein n=1 Tax=Orchesella dallaii TaxID=48710 RepID=A0ABP1S367_9HEXA